MFQGHLKFFCFLIFSLPYLRVSDPVFRSGLWPLDFLTNFQVVLILGPYLRTTALLWVKMLSMTSFASFSNLISYHTLKLMYFPCRPKYCVLLCICTEDHMFILYATSFISLPHCSEALSTWLANDHIKELVQTQFWLGSIIKLLFFLLHDSQVRQYLCITLHYICQNAVCNYFFWFAYCSTEFLILFLYILRNVSVIPGV